MRAKRVFCGLAAATATTLLIASDAFSEAETAHGASHDHAHHVVEGTAPLSGRSIYQLEGSWRDVQGGAFALKELRGHPVVALLFYGTCAHACPALVHELQELDKALDPAQRSAVRYLLVTFDPERDTPETLAAFARDKQLETDRWKFAVGESHQIRELALLLGVQYRSTGDGEFSHTSRLTLLDREGVISTSADGLDGPHHALVEPLRTMLSTAAPGNP